LVGEDGADERGARPTNNAPDPLQLARQHADGSPDYHGWPDRLGFLPSSQAVFNPIGGSSDDVCPPPFSQTACLAALKAAGAMQPIAQCDRARMLARCLALRHDRPHGSYASSETAKEPGAVN
jgi:hypothetical protein